MRIHIVGLGNVGSLVAFYLRKTLHPKHTVVALHQHPKYSFIASKAHDGAILLEESGIVQVQKGIVHECYDPVEDVIFQNTQNVYHHDRSLPTVRDLKSGKVAPSPALRAQLDEHPGPIDSLIITTKAYATNAVINGLLPRISRNTTIVLLQNGMGMYEKLITDTFRNPQRRPNFILTSNTHGLWYKDFMHVAHTGIGAIELGIIPDPLGRDYEASTRHPDIPRPEQKLQLDDIMSPTEANPDLRYQSLRNTIAALTNAEGLNATWRPIWDVQMAMRRKVVVNSVINPITALLHCTNGEVLKERYGQWLADRICHEASNVFRAQWREEVEAQQAEERERQLHTGSVSTVLHNKPLFPRELEEDALRTEVERVVRITARNMSSMLFDVRQGRPTEIEYLNGYLMKLGAQYDAGMLITQSLYNLIKMRSSTIPQLHPV